MRTHYCLVGRVMRTHGKRGAVVMRPQAGFRQPLQEGMVVAVVPPALRDDRFQRVSSVDEGPKGQIVRFSRITDREGAYELVGRWVLANVGDVEREGSPAAFAEWVGLSVRDLHEGPLGLVRSVEQGGGQPLLVVDGARGTLLIPAVEPLIVQQTEQELVVDCPSGLLSLNEGPSN